ncbi:Uncharacterised protein [Yersinia aldovae]|uniref:hypothetical protein n=1 Tax=Yersinia aldovae TaxID=29483 RepID=UPI0005E0CE27|nr:hypothetical protein [Yersinia aldovae]CNJ03149.1 Uncharacterised protein [Yersinia aldovae]
MKTVDDLQRAVRYEQTQSAFIEYLTLLVDAGVIEPLSGVDIVDDGGVLFVSDEFFKRIASVYGIQLDEELNPVKFYF